MFHTMHCFVKNGQISGVKVGADRKGANMYDNKTVKQK